MAHSAPSNATEWGQAAGGGHDTETWLVLALYLCLLADLVLVARGQYSAHVSGKGANLVKGKPFRPAVKMHSLKKPSSLYHNEKKRYRSLDNLWRRMQKATNQMRLVNLRHHMITKVMMEARIQAREKERERLHQRKGKRVTGKTGQPCTPLQDHSVQ